MTWAAMASRLKLLIGASFAWVIDSVARFAAKPVNVVRWTPKAATSQVCRARSSAAPRDAATTITSEPDVSVRKRAASCVRSA